MPAPIDIKGMRFNNLVAIKKAESRNGHTYWKFKCDCGNEKEIMTSAVTRGDVKSCGCLQEALKVRRIEICDNVQPTDPIPRVCKICRKQFFGFVGDNRLFCYDCSPRGASSADASRSKKRAMKHLLVEYKGGKCVECGYDKCEGALQFHHIDEGTKDFTLANMKINEVSMTDLYKEADRCILLCANCHAQKHAVDDKVGFIMKLTPMLNAHTNETKKCIVCDTEFIPEPNNRKYCYSCLPCCIDKNAAKRARFRAVKLELLKYKGSRCVSCGYCLYEGSLQFHHRNPNEKEFELSKVKLGTNGMTMEKMKREVDKCDVLCANCHAELHYTDDDFDLE